MHNELRPWYNIRAAVTAATNLNNEVFMLAAILPHVGATIFASLWITSGVLMGSVAFGVVDS